MALEGRLDCPHCKTSSKFDIRQQMVVDRNERHSIVSCTICGKHTYLLTDTSNNLKFQYPIAGMSIDQSIPQEVAEDYIEGMKCLSVGAHKAAVTMFRRSLQTALLQKGALRGELRNQIDELAGRNTIPSDLKDLAHNIRVTGNDGAHPNLVDIRPEDAKEIKEFTDHFFDYVYVIPSRVAKMKSRNKS